MQEPVPIRNVWYEFHNGRFVNVGESPFWFTLTTGLAVPITHQQQAYMSPIREQIRSRRHLSTIIGLNEEYIPFNPTIIKPLVETKVEPFSFADTEAEFACFICMDTEGNVEDKHAQMCKLQCSHTMCITCTQRILQRNNLCPMCREPIAQICVQNENSKRLLDEHICD